MRRPTILAAIDLGPSTSRVLYHAAAFARLLGAQLTVLHVDSDVSADARARVLDACLRLAPYAQALDDEQIVIRPGRVSDGIARQARAGNAAMVVMGARSHNGIARLLLGSTAEAVLRNATVPVLLVPPTDMDIASVGDRVALTCGPVIAAVDLGEDSREQVEMAARVARIGSQPLLLMTVAKTRTSDRAATMELRERAHDLPAIAKPRALIVRRGAVAEEISRCAVVEGAGLVVMGVRAGSRGRPGAIATAVLKTKRAFVLAVPSARPAVVEQPRRFQRLALIASLVTLCLAPVVTSASAQGSGDVRAIVEFQRAADAYAFMHRQVEMRLELAHRGWQEVDPVSAAELAAAIVARRTSSAPWLFTARVSTAFREMASAAARGPGCDPGELRTGAWEMRHDVNTPATGTMPVAPCIRTALPDLPDELEYRSAGTVLVIVDTHANLVVDVLPALLAQTVW